MLVRCLALFLAVIGAITAQTITGTITGSVRDPGGLAVAGAEIKLVQQGTGAERASVTGERGSFTIGSLPPGTYDLAVSVAGFKRYEMKSVVLSASEVLAVPEIVLEIGALAEQITVEARAATVQTATAERAGVIGANQVENLQVRNRTALGLVQLLPGVVDIGGSEGPDRNWLIHVQGNRRNTNNVSMDGLTVNASNNFNAVVTVGMDAIEEVKILVSNHQAEYGRMSGANINIVTKSGTRHFHGLGSYFKRHEQFNASDFFSNRLGLPKSLYRYNTWSYNVGGPVYIPGKFNRNRDKLFFFFSQEYWPLRNTQPVRQVTVPTALERAGDYSQSVDLNGRLIPVVDPVSRQPFAGNKIPTSRIDPNGQALLNVFPAPNFLDRAISAGRYNYVFQTTNNSPKRSESLKFDYNANSANRLFITLATTKDSDSGAMGIPDSGGTNWPQMTKTYSISGKALVGRYTRVFSPTLINELNVGGFVRPARDSYADSEVKRNQRDTAGYKLGQFHPENNPFNLIPNATFGGVPGSVIANLLIEGRFPLSATRKASTITNNITKVLGVHTLKAGIFWDHLWDSGTPQVAFQGSFDFGRNANNPLDTGYAYANAIAGVFNAYTEPTFRPSNIARKGNIEWFAQDNWKATRRLTLDCGIRFYVLPPEIAIDDNLAGFVPGAFDPRRQVQLIRPALVNGTKVGVDPVTGRVLPAPLIGAIAGGAGDVKNGFVVAANDRSYPRAMMYGRGVLYAPRIGFAYDLTGDGKTALRGGFGVFFGRNGSSLGGYNQTPVINFGTLPTLLSSSGLLFPQNVDGMDFSGYSANVMNYSFSVQRNVGMGTVVDIAYVGSLGRHLLWTRNLNSIPFGSNFDPKNADPTNTRVPLPDVFLRPYMGYRNITFSEPASSSNYHSLQVSANRRFARGLQFGVAWTWSKAMDFTDLDNGSVSTQVPVRVWDYGLAGFDRTHVLKANWLWDVPKTPFQNPVAKSILNGWTLSGIPSFVSGVPTGIGFTQTTAVDITGSSTDGARIVVLDNPVLPKSERSFSRNFRTDVFAPPAKGTVGNAARTLIRGPGINSWDLALIKNLPLRGDKARLQFKWELYNAFNHTQFSALDTTARFDPAGQQVNARLGEFTATYRPRQMQFALRLYF